eukprot:CAMPEP_0194553612 /NCGR_PEP_ID=MMETSP0253-20130528/97320_1 /TAXON_ID=2966 /ORGANISM="Noctiluca scintillans" /LENGTH=121 /DNA_ID=CAMNT_0039401093 /DNA_START=431 /DNA_END=796 /DNA_ORIENTATION=+
MTECAWTYAAPERAADMWDHTPPRQLRIHQKKNAAAELAPLQKSPPALGEHAALLFLNIVHHPCEREVLQPFRCIITYECAPATTHFVVLSSVIELFAEICLRTASFSPAEDSWLISTRRP